LYYVFYERRLFMKKRIVFWSLLMALVFFLVIGFTTLKAQEAKAPTPKDLATRAKITMAEALETALKAAPGKAVAAELEKEKGKLIFTFDILPSITSETITEVQVEAITGKVISRAEEKIGGKEEEAEKKGEEKEEKSEAREKGDQEIEKEEVPVPLKDLVASSKITMVEALKIVQTATSGVVLAGELEKEEGKIIFSFDILPSPESQVIHEIQVDAATGKVIAQEEEKIK
jgi:uncharacterized membrane protein YkoI